MLTTERSSGIEKGFHSISEPSRTDSDGQSADGEGLSNGSSNGRPRLPAGVQMRGHLRKFLLHREREPFQSPISTFTYLFA